MKNALAYTVVNTKSRKMAQTRKRYIFKLQNIRVNRYTRFYITQEAQQKARFFWKLVYSTYYDKNAMVRNVVQCFVMFYNVVQRFIVNLKKAQISMICGKVYANTLLSNYT